MGFTMPKARTTNKSRATFRWAVSLLVVATVLTIAGLLAGPALAQEGDFEGEQDTGEGEDVAQVDGNIPTVSSIAIVSDSDPTAGSEADRDDTYAIGDTIEILVTFSEPVINKGGMRLTLDVGGESREAYFQSPVNFSDPHTTMLFTYTVPAGDEDTDGVSIPENSLTLTTGTLRDVDGNDAILDHAALADDPRHKVDGLIPFVSSVAIISDPGDDNTYGAGDAIIVRATFSEDVYIKGNPELALDIGGAVKLATYTFSGNDAAVALASNTATATVTLSYTVAVGDVDTDGVSIPRGYLRKVDVRDVAGNRGDGDYAEVPADLGHMVNAPGGL